MKLFYLWCLLIVCKVVNADPIIFCDVDKGLELVNKKNYSQTQVKKIIHDCGLTSSNNFKVYLLQGLEARNENSINHNYAVAIEWFLKAHKLDPQNLSIILELANTFELAHEWGKAWYWYQNALSIDSNNRSAQLGQARILRFQNNLVQAEVLYDKLLAKNPNDYEALNGKAWVNAAENKMDTARFYFGKTLKILPQNQEALTGIDKISQTLKQISDTRLASTSIKAVNGTEQKTSSPVKIKSNKNMHSKSEQFKQSIRFAEEGLILLNKPNPSLSRINYLAHKADQIEPNQVSTLMLHGLIARRLGNYSVAILWFKRAENIAQTGYNSPKLELAVTYEWANAPDEALKIYQNILYNNPNNHAALLGKARTLKALYKIQSSKELYKRMLNKSPDDIEALNGYGETLLANYELREARQKFAQSLALSSGNKQAITDLKLLDKVTKNILGLSGGYYTVPPKSSEGLNLYYFRNLNATDGLTLLTTHNSKQIESGFGFGPTLLPNNSVLIGYQRILPQKYNWQLSYDARQHNGLPFEHRLFATGGLYLNSNIEWFNGFRWIFPSPWNTRLFISGLTLHTNLPANFSITGFWAEQEIGGYNSSYAFDISKEFDNRLFYDVGISILPEQQNSWEIHGRLLLPTFKNQAFVFEGSHYFFNDSSFITAGWRFYWA